MVDVIQIPNLPAATSLDGAEMIEVVQGGVSSRATVEQFADHLGAVSSVNGQTGTVVLTKNDIGLGNVDNTSDANKPVSTATQTALNLKAPSVISAANLPATYDATMPAIRRRLRIMPDLGDYGITSSGVTNYGQSDFNAVAAGLLSEGMRDIYCPPGNYRLGEQIEIGLGIRFIGESRSTTVFKMYHGNTGFVFTGAQEVGGGLLLLSVVNDSGAQCTAYVQGIASVGGTSPDFLTISDCNFTGFSGATSQYGIIFDGNARDGSAPNALIGIRNGSIVNTSVFNCDIMSTALRRARGIYISGLEHYQAGGAVSKIQISGASSLHPSHNVRINNAVLGEVSIQYATKVLAAGCDVANCTITSDANFCDIGVATGTVINNSTTSTVHGLS